MTAPVPGRPDLRLVEETGEVVCIECERKDRDILGLERDLRGKRAQISKLLNEKRERLREDARYDDALALYTRWREKCRPRAARVPTDERLELLYARMKQYDVETLERAIDGASVDAFRSRDGTTHNWLEQILRGAKQVEMNVDRWERYRRRVRLEELKRAFPALPAMWPDPEPGRMLGECPVCGTTGRVTLRAGHVVFDCFAECAKGARYRLPVGWVCRSCGGVGHA